MRKITILVGLILMFAVFSVRAEVVAQDQPPGTMLEEKKKTDRAKVVACKCCEDCMAAKKPEKPETVLPEEKAPLATDGCRDCCQRCGKVIKPPEEKIPPEIIKQK
jgi:hypothetical protein